jgi:hypothetical protein
MNHAPIAYVPGLVVAYVPPTDTRGSRWRATLTRGTGAANRFRVSIPYADGPDAAARAVVDRFNEAMGADWIVYGAALSLDGGSHYAYPAGPRDVADPSATALDRIATTLSGSAWSADTVDAVADIIRATGRTIADLP